MNRQIQSRLLALLITLMVPVWLIISGSPVPADTTEPAPDKISETQHSIKIGKEEPLTYKASAGTLTLKNDEGKATAQIFFVAYTRPTAPNQPQRPVMFTFNGGPGSSSVWLHMGAFGPRRVQLKEDGSPLPPPGRIVDNEFTLLEWTDLVFIDPVSTGFSRPAKGQEAKAFHGVEEDIQSVGEFIRLYCTRFKRWDSPKYLAGESYGTTRAAALANYLQETVGMSLNGVLLISAVLNFQTISPSEGNDLPYPLFLPSYTATAYHHKKLSSEMQAMDLRKVLDEAEAFAVGEYTTALMRGDRLSDADRTIIRKKLAQFSGLSEDYVERARLRIDPHRFMKELLRNQNRSVGRYDSRFQGIESTGVGERFDYDPSYAAVQGAYTTAANSYLRTELKVDNPGSYEILTGKVQPWNYGNAKNRYLNVAPQLRDAMTRNPELRVFVASGFYDLATPYFATDYTMDHLGLDRTLRNHITTSYYDAGHMMYIRKADHGRLRDDIGRFLRTQLVEQGKSE